MSTRSWIHCRGSYGTKLLKRTHGTKLSIPLNSGGGPTAAIGALHWTRWGPLLRLACEVSCLQLLSKEGQDCRRSCYT